MPRRRRLLSLPLLLAVGLLGAAALLAVLELGGGWGGLGGLLGRRSERAEPVSLEADAARSDGAAHGPLLSGRARSAPAATHGPVDVVVRDRAGAPVEGLRVLAEGLPAPAPPEGEAPAPLTAEAFTDALGRARFEDLPYGGQVTLTATARTALPDAPAPWPPGPTRIKVLSGLPLLGRLGSPEQEGAPVLTFYPAREAVGVLAQVRVHGPEAELVVTRGLPLRIDVRLAGDGRALPAARYQLVPRLPWADEAWGATTVPAEAGAEVTVDVRVEAPRGTVARRDASFSTVIHPEAQRLEALYPLRPALDLVVLFPPEVLPFRESAWEPEVTVAGIRLERPELAWAGTGRLRVHGGSHGVTEPVEVGGVIDGRWRVSGRARMGPDPRESVVVEVRVEPLAPAEPPPEASTAEAGGSIVVEGGAIVLEKLELVLRGSTVQLRLAPPDPQDAGGEVPAPPAPGALVVQALTSEGAPAAGAVVRVGERSARADAEGRVRFEALPAGPVTVSLLGAGAACSTEARVLPGATSDVVLRAGRGGTLEVELVDAQGHRIPMGTVHVDQPSGLPWLDLRDGVQRLDPFTDAAGRRTLEGVEAGHLTVHGSYGTRQVSVEVDLAEGQRLPVRLVLPVP